MQSARWILKRMDYPGDIVLSGREEYSVGRAKSNYGTVISLLVSRLHCIFRTTENGLIVKDLNSSNGTYVNDQRIPANTDCIIKVSDVIGIGVNSPKAADHFVFKVVKENREDSNNVVPKNLRNERVKEIESAREEISYIYASEEEENENDEPLIIEQEIDLVDLIDEEYNLTTAGSTSKSASSTFASHSNSGASTSFVVDNRKTICIKKEKCDSDLEGSETCVNSGKRATNLRSDSCDEIILRRNEYSVKDIKVESEVKLCTAGKHHNSQPRRLNVASDDNQSMVTVQKSSSTKVNFENNKKSKSFQNDLPLSDLQSRNVPEIKIKEESINTSSTRDSCENNDKKHNKEKQCSFDSTNRSRTVTDVGTSSKNVIVATVKQEKVDDCRNTQLTKNVSENINRKDLSCVPKEKICASSSSRIEGAQKSGSKRIYKDSVLSLPSVSTCEYPAAKKRKYNFIKYGDDSSSTVSSTITQSEKSYSSQSQTSVGVESDNEDILFNMYAVPILDELEKADTTKSVNLYPHSSNNLVRQSTKNYTITNVDSNRRRNPSTFMLCEMQTLPAYLNPVVVLEKLDLKKIQEDGCSAKQETEISLDDILFEEAMQVLTSSPKHSDFHQSSQSSHTSESHNKSIINYSQSDDVIVIDDDDDYDDDFLNEGKSSKSLFQKHEDNEDVKEEICVKQEVFDDDEQVIEEEEDDEDDNELVNDWVFRLSQSSSPVIEDQIRPPGKLKKRSLFILDSESSDEDPPSNLEKNVSVGKDIANQSPNAHSDKISKIPFYSSKNQSNVVSLKSKELMNIDQSKTKTYINFTLDSDRSDEDSPANLEKNVSVGNDTANQSPDANSDKISKIFFDSSTNLSNKASLKSKVVVINALKDQSEAKTKRVDQNSKKSLSVQIYEDNQIDNESDISDTSLNMYAETLLENAVSAYEKKPRSTIKNCAEGNITKEWHENAKSSANYDSSRRTLMCSALPMKPKSRSKATSESRDQKKTSHFNSEETKHWPVNEINITDLTRNKTSSSECKSKSSLHKKIDSNSYVSEKELKMKAKEDRKAKLKALTKQKKKTTSDTKAITSSKSSVKSYHQSLVKNTSSSRADKLAESLADSLQTKISKSQKIKVRVTKKSSSETNSKYNSAVSEDNSSRNTESVINPVALDDTSIKQNASESSGAKLDQDITVSEVGMSIKKISFKDVYKIPKLKQSNNSKPTKELHSAASTIKDKHQSKPSEIIQQMPRTSALRKFSALYQKKTVHFAPAESLCKVQTYFIEAGNILRRIDGKDIPVRKRLAEQVEVLYDTSTKTMNRVTTAILRHWNPRWLTEQAVILRSGGEPPPAHCQSDPVSTLCPMLTAFSNYEEYLKIIDPLMMLDLWAKVSDDTNKPNQRMKRKYDISVLETKDANGIVTLNCSMPLKSKEEKEGLCPHVGDLCILRYPVWDHSNVSGHNIVTSQQETYYERFAYIHSLTKDFRSSNNNWNQWSTSGNSRQFSPTYGVMNLVIKVKSGSPLKVINATLKIISGIRSELRHFEAVGYLQHTKLCKMILNPCIEDYKLPRTDPNVKIVSEDSLNEAQRSAVIKGAFVCTHSTPRICLIQGPPGTGKTQVILNIIKQVLYPNGQYSKARFDKKLRILLCAPSNAAADEMAERLLTLRTQMPKENRFKMVRTGPKEYMRESVRGISLDELAKKDVEQVVQHQTQLESVEIEIVTLEARKRSFVMACEHAAAKRESTDMYQKRIQETEKRIADLRSSKKNVPVHKTVEKEREAKKKVLTHADIIVTTLSSSYSSQMTDVFASRSSEMCEELHNVVKPKISMLTTSWRPIGTKERNGRSSIRFACCIIDEATQCTEPESLIPLMLGIERIVLVGDPEQLPATVLSQVAKTKSFGQSLFNRIWNKFQNEVDNPIIFLNTQYRMHPEIYHWPNTYIYHGKVMTDPSCNSAYPLKPYCVLAHRFQQHSHNFVNSSEVKLVCDIAMAVAHSFPDFVKTVGIITPYQQQLQEIKTCLERSRINNIAVIVNTIDGFQGRECDVIIFSCVRTRGIGFMGESQRLNVALTRARRSLFICGNFVSLQEDKMWSSLLSDAMQREVLVNPPNKILNVNEILKCLMRYS